ncbi:SGNH/GDSL hydrolase family protein, partial [Mycoplasmopsis lipofaciens]|uniref:SGNH/GDSL hydrolase family protein n=1 Tax=Mycoplasmopsis lipofaciens TaxID=114884 RepID=UPI00048A4376
MKIKAKQTIGIIAGTFAATVALAVGLSFIPTKDKKIKKVNGVVYYPDDNGDFDVPGLPSIKDNPKNNDDVHNIPISKLSPRDKSRNFIGANDAIKYVALGDSISAGFQGDMPKDYPGSFVDNKIEGLSFPAYLASFFQNAQENKLESFFNFAKSGSRFSDWNLLLNTNDFTSLTNEQRNILTNYFGNDLLAAKQLIIDKLSQANLLTVTLGANDFLTLTLNNLANAPLLDLINQLANSNLNYSLIVSLVNDFFNDVFENLKTRQIEFIKTIKSINSNLNINFIGYPMPIAFIAQLIDAKLGDNSNISISKIILDLLNKKIKFIANSNGEFFINPYNSDKWNREINLFTPLLFDIHPSSFGYKKMAMDIFTKLITPSRDIDYLKSLNLDWNYKYLQSDQDSFLYQIEFTKKSETIINEIFGNDKDIFLKNEDSFYLKHESEKSESNYIKRVLDDTRFSNFIFNNLLFNFFNSDFYKNIDPSNALKIFLNRDNKRNLNKMIEWFNSNKIVSNLFISSQKRFFETDWDNDNVPGSKHYTLDNLIKSFKEEFLDEEKNIKLITSFLKIDFFENQKSELKQIIENIIQNVLSFTVTNKQIEKFLNPFYNNKIAKFISKNDLLNLIKIVLNSKTLKETVGSLFVNIINDSNSYSKATSYQELWNIFINSTLNQNSIKQAMFSITKELTSNLEFKQIISRLISKLIKESDISVEIFNDIEESDLTKLNYDLIETLSLLDEKLKFSDIIANSLINELINSSPLKLNVTNIFKVVKTNIEAKFDNEHLEETILKIIKIVRNSNLNQHNETIKKLIKSSLKYLANSDLLTRFVDKLYANNNNVEQLLQKDDFTNLLKKTLNSDELNTLANNLIQMFWDTDLSKINDATTLFDLI